MERLQLPNDISPDMAIFLKSVMDSASPLPIVLDAAPTTAGEELKEGQVGYFSGFKYETINGVTYKYALTQV